MKDFLKYVNISELHEKIDEFRDLDFKRMSYAEVGKAIHKVISFEVPETPGGSRTALSCSSYNYPSGMRFYRVRTIPADDRSRPLKTMCRVSDCWEPPANVVKSGRLNRDSEPLLYTAAESSIVAVEEMKIKEGELFSLIVYEAVEEIRATAIGFPVDAKDLTEEESLKARMIQGFLKHEFIRDVGVGTEYLYRISETIVKDYFDLPPDFQDAWCYPSIAKKGGFNVCFREGRRSKLRLIGVQIGTVVKQGDETLHRISAVASASGDGINLSYYEAGSDKYAYLFPELIVADRLLLWAQPYLSTHYYRNCPRFELNFNDLKSTIHKGLRTFFDPSVSWVFRLVLRKVWLLV